MLCGCIDALESIMNSRSSGAVDIRGFGRRVVECIISLLFVCAHILCQFPGCSAGAPLFPRTLESTEFVPEVHINAS